MRHALNDEPTGTWTGYRMLFVGGLDRATASAAGTDRKHHFVNVFLDVYSPFFADEIWMPMDVLSMGLSCFADMRQHVGLSDIWQTSRPAFMNTRGDYEDHAIIRTDWLAVLGCDANVVAERVNSGGHTWVVVDLDGKFFLLEAARKGKRHSCAH